MSSSISDKTRKILWGRSGSRCAICKRELIIDATNTDDEAVIGEECHIISPQVYGPRHDSTFPQEKMDAYDNLILLCRIDHKMIDDQPATFTKEILHQIKNNHEVEISVKLSEKEKPKPIKLRRVKKNIPNYLGRLKTGKQVLDLLSGTYGFDMNHDELSSQDEVDIVGGFFQDVSDYIDLIDEFEPSARISSSYYLSQMINKLEEIGFYVFGGRELRYLEGGVSDEPTNWPVAIIYVLRSNNETIIME